MSNASHSSSARTRTPIAIPSTTRTKTGCLWLLAQLTRAPPAASGSVAAHPHTHRTHHGGDVIVCVCVCVCKCYKLPVSEQYHIHDPGSGQLSALPLPLSHPRRVSFRRPANHGPVHLCWEVYPSPLELQNRFLLCIYYYPCPRWPSRRLPAPAPARSPTREGLRI